MSYLPPKAVLEALRRHYTLMRISESAAEVEHMYTPLEVLGRGTSWLFLPLMEGDPFEAYGRRWSKLEQDKLTQDEWQTVFDLALHEPDLAAGQVDGWLYMFSYARRSGNTVYIPTSNITEMPSQHTLRRLIAAYLSCQTMVDSLREHCYELEKVIHFGDEVSKAYVHQWLDAMRPRVTNESSQ